MMITAIIVTYNSGSVIEAALRCVYGHPRVLECIVVDNGSEDQTTGLVQAGFPEARIIRNNANAGFGAACNQALATVSTGMALLLNPDAFIDNEGIEALAGCMASHPAAAIVAPAIEGHNDVIAAAQAAVPVTFISGAIALWRMEYMRKVGFFDPAFFLFYEDNDISIRVVRSGYQLLLLSGVNVKHVPGKSCVLTDELESLKLRSSTWSFLYITGKYRGRIWAKLNALLMAIHTFCVCQYYTRHRIDEPSQRLAAELAGLNVNWLVEEKKLRERARAMEAVHNERLAAIIKIRDERAGGVEKTLRAQWNGFACYHEEKVEATKRGFEEQWRNVMTQNENIQAKKAEHERQWSIAARALGDEWADEIKRHEAKRAEMVGEYEKEWHDKEEKLRMSWYERSGRHQEQFARLVRQYEGQRSVLLKELEIHYPALRKMRENRDILWAVLYYLRNSKFFNAYAE